MSSRSNPTDELLRNFSTVGNNPYIFATAKPFEAKTQSQAPRRPYEEAILREQRLTFFENDQAMQTMFNHDFEGYSAALDNPDLMLERLAERMQQIQQEIAERGADLPAWWQDEFWGEEFIEDEEIMSLDSADDDWVEELESDWQSDPLYQQANKWAHRLLEVGEKIYETEGRQEPDLFRVLVNVFLVPAKIVYASSVIADELDEMDAEATEIESEISLHGYTLCLIFLQRVRESLANLAQKNFAPVAEWRAALLAADELALGVRGRMIELAKKLRKS